MKTGNLCMVARTPATKCLLITKGKSTFSVEKLGRHHLNQMIKVNIISNGAN